MIHEKTREKRVAHLGSESRLRPGLRRALSVPVAGAAGGHSGPAQRRGARAFFPPTQKRGGKAVWLLPRPGHEQSAAGKAPPATPLSVLPPKELGPGTTGAAEGPTAQSDSRRSCRELRSQEATSRYGVKACATAPQATCFQVSCSIREAGAPGAAPFGLQPRPPGRPHTDTRQKQRPSPARRTTACPTKRSFSPT